MPFPECPHCGATKHLDQRTFSHHVGPLRCYEFKGLFHVEIGDLPGTERMRFGPGEGGVLLSPARAIGDPVLLEQIKSTIIPPSLIRDIEEAVRCLEVDAPRGSAVLCRHAIQEALIIKNVRDDRTVEQMVNIAHQTGILSEAAHRQCRAAVFLGTKAAHPQESWTDEIGQREARAALDLTQRVLLELFAA